MLKDPTFYRNTKHVLSGNYNSWAKDVYRWLFPDTVRIKARRWVMNQLEYVRVSVAPQTTPPQIAEETRLMLKERYEQDVAALKRLTGENFAPWKDFDDSPRINE